VVQRGNVQALEHRVDRHPLAAFEPVPETHRRAVDQDQIHLGVRHPERFDQIHHRRRAGKLVIESHLAPCRRQEVVELLV